MEKNRNKLLKKWLKIRGEWPKMKQPSRSRLKLFTFIKMKEKKITTEKFQKIIGIDTKQKRRHLK